MAGKLHKLSARSVAIETKPGRHADGGNLYLNVTKTGARSWVFMFKLAGRQREMGLGSVRDVSLAKARDLAATARQAVAEGRDPLQARQAVAVQTFGECADAYIEAMRPGWRNAKHAAQWTMTLTKYAEPLRGLLVSEVDTAAVLDVLQKLWARTPETAERLRGRIESVLDAAKAKGLRSGENPARWRGHLDQLLPKRQRLSRGHHAALPFVELPAFMAALRGSNGLSARALELTILTAARSGEALGAEWDEFDLDAALWTIPPVRMKGGREHRVPLSAEAVAIIRGLEQSRRGRFLFPGPNAERPLSNMAMGMLLRRLKVDVTTHGFRSTFRDWASETTSFSHEVCGMALAHVIANKAEAAYRRGDLFEKRRLLMEAWASFCAEPVNGKVVRLAEVLNPAASAGT